MCNLPSLLELAGCKPAPRTVGSLQTCSTRLNKISHKRDSDRSMSAQDPEVLLEDNHLLVVNKPAGLATMGVAKSENSLISWAKQYLKEKYQKPGNVYVGVVSRLDAPVTGIVVMARTSKAAARLTEQFRSRDVEKTYWAVVTGRPRPAAGKLEDWIRKDKRHRRVHICRSADADAQQAQLEYQIIKALGDQSLLAVRLHTGRKHQIRVQLSYLGHPIVGDRKYGSRTPFPQGIALHSRQLHFTHPVRNSVVELVAPLPKSWAKTGVDDTVT